MTQYAGMTLEQLVTENRRLSDVRAAARAEQMGIKSALDQLARAERLRKMTAGLDDAEFDRLRQILAAEAIESDENVGAPGGG